MNFIYFIGNPKETIEIKSEKDVFDNLGIEYKKPEERDIIDEL